MFHRNIRIEGNFFELHEKRFLHACHIDGLVMRENHYVQNDTLPVHSPIGTDGILISDCYNVHVCPPEEG